MLCMLAKLLKEELEKIFLLIQAHPYTWALISAIPENDDERLFSIQGTPPDMANLPIGDPFAPRNDFALEIDYEKEPPLIEINSHHKARQRDYFHPDAPKIQRPKELEHRLKSFRKVFKDDEE